MCAVVCSYCMSHQHLDAKIVKHFPQGGFPRMYGWEPTFESWLTPTKAGMHRVAFKTDKGMVTAISMCAVVCSYCMSHQHLDAKIVIISQ